jgi:hypothetical protein
MNDLGHDSPEAAAMTGFPAHCRVVGLRLREDDAYVLLNTGSREQPYLYGVNCGRKNGRWFEGGSSNGPGWEQAAHYPDVGTLSLWGDAPVGSDAVRVAFEGAYFLVWWRVPCPSQWPRVVAILVDGTWQPYSELGCEGCIRRAG